MQLKPLLAAVAGGSMTLASFTAVAEPTYFVSPMVGVAYSDFDDHHTGTSAQLGVGVNLTERFGLEAKAFYNDLDIDLDEKYRQKGMSLDAFYKFVKRPKWEMYGVTGIGFVRQDVPPGEGDGEDDSVDPSFDLGFGFLFPMNSISTALRTDFRYRNDYHGDADTYGQSSFYQLFAQVGLVFPYRSEEPYVAPTARPDPVQPLPRDGDNDGVVNAFDECPDTPAGMSVLPNGCSIDQDLVLDGVNFEFNSARLTPNARLVLDDVAETIKSTPGINLEISGHTDDVGNAKYNQRLSEQRAASVRNYLVSKGVSRSRLSSIGYGEAKPVASNGTDAGRAENRRVELNPQRNGSADAGMETLEDEVTARTVATLAKTNALSGKASAPAVLQDWSTGNAQATSREARFLGFAGKHLTSSARRELNAVAGELLGGSKSAALTVEGQATAAQLAAIRDHLTSRGVASNRLQADNNGSNIRLEYSF